MTIVPEVYRYDELTKSLLAAGSVALKAGSVNSATEHLSRLLAIDPSSVDGLNVYALSCEQYPTSERAEIFLRRASYVSPLFAAAHCNLGHLLSKVGQWKQALPPLGKALTLNPQMREAYQNLGNLRANESSDEHAAKMFCRLTILSPADAEAFHNLGVASQKLQRLSDAKDAFSHALALAPARHDSVFGYSKCFTTEKNPSTHTSWVHRALAVDPTDSSIQSEAGLILAAADKNQDASVHFCKAIALIPNGSDHYNNLGLSIGNLTRDSDAIRLFDRALILDYLNSSAHYNKGISLQHLGTLDESVRSNERALILDPSHVDAFWNRSHAMLLAGNYLSGWREYEWRWRIKQFSKQRRSKLRTSPWKCLDDVRGRTILLVAEQGLGDTLQFCRYAHLLADHGATVVLSVQRPLVRLLRNQRGIAQVVEWGDNLPEYDAQCPMMSLPFAFGTTIETIPYYDKPYLSAQPIDTTKWARRLDARFNRLAESDRRPRVGVVWNGGFRPDQPEVWAVNERRNVSLRDFASALDIMGIDFVSLQKGDPAESQLRGHENEYWAKSVIFNPVDDLTDFADTAALIANLDLVIGVDTSTAHLSAALGKPTWILNRFDTCWRWMLGREDSPWYATVKLYRQTSERNWAPVLEQVRKDLQKWASSFNGSNLPTRGSLL